MTRFMEDRAPLELTKVSAKQKVMVCPKCQLGRSTSVQCVGVICSQCGTYFNEKDSLPEDQAKGMLGQKIIDPEYIKMREKMEADAYAYKENVLDKKKKGHTKTHEPEDIKKLRDSGLVKD